MTKLIDQLQFEEVLRLYPSLSQNGFKAIGYGHNIEKNPKDWNGKRILNAITKAFAEELLFQDVAEIESQLRAAWPRITEFDPARRDAFIQMAFQLGVAGFMRFECLRAAALARDWPIAHHQALKSTWAERTPARAVRVAQQILTGKYYEIEVNPR